MAKYVQEGKHVDYTPSGADVTAGDVVVQGDLLGVAAADIADGVLGALTVEGVFDFPKTLATAFAAGDLVQWDGSEMIAATTGAVHGTVVTAANGTDDTTVRVLISPSYAAQA